jgi:DNA-binding protein YbaB
MTRYDQEIDDLLTEYRERRAKAGELRRTIEEIAVSVTAPRAAVKVTVNAQGQVAAIEFPTGGYKRMPPAELAATLMDTIGEATQKALAAVRELMTPELPAGLNFMELLQGKADLATVLPEEPSMPDAVREYVEYGRGPHSAGGPNG